MASSLSETGLELEINLLHLRPQLLPVTGAPFPELVEDSTGTQQTDVCNGAEQLWRILGHY